ncbi:hypothetical protein [Altererythrobacter fulvus]|uniref:hypothetical protein n=1 Tax=Caenibius fulvus TaxID=2126012 RepID=UPI0030180D29
MRRLAFTIAIASMLAGCGGAEPGVYAVPLAEALQRLKKADVDGFRSARQCGILIHFASDSPKDDAITWRVSSSGREVLRFTVRLTAEGDGTRAQIEVPAEAKGGEMYDGSQFYPRPALHQPLRPAVQELIDAAMEQRPFDVMRIPDDKRSSPNDGPCEVQRAGLEQGSSRFGLDDKPGYDSRRSQQLRDMEDARSAQEGQDSSYGQPMDDTRGSW